MGFVIMAFNILSILLLWGMTTIILAFLWVAGVLSSVILWFRGIWGIYQWFRWRNREDTRKWLEVWEQRRCPLHIMHGEVNWARWLEAWEIARSIRINDEERYYAHEFDVKEFLKKTTALEMKHLSLLRDRRDGPIGRFKRETDDVDREIERADRAFKAAITAVSMKSCDVFPRTRLHH